MPLPPNEDCPICMLPLPSLYTGRKYRACCGKMICSGCIHAVKKRDGGVGLCPFCRAPGPTTEEMIEQMKKRMKVGDAVAIYTAGSGCTDSLEYITQIFMNGHATKDDYAKALRSYQANLVEIKSPQRDQAAAFSDNYKYY